jgi:hypothetical protein
MVDYGIAAGSDLIYQSYTDRVPVTTLRVIISPK